MCATTCTLPVKLFGLMDKAHDPAFTPDECAALDELQEQGGQGHQVHSDWVKVAVALALGLGTMVGWKRIVVTVGERIGKEHLTYAQGASAGLVAMGTILVADELRITGEHYAYSQFRAWPAPWPQTAAGCASILSATLRRDGFSRLPAAALLSGLLFALFREFAH